MSDCYINLDREFGKLLMTRVQKIKDYCVEKTDGYPLDNSLKIDSETWLTALDALIKFGEELRDDWLYEKPMNPAVEADYKAKMELFTNLLPYLWT